MAAQTLSAISNALSQLFDPDLRAQYNRQAIVASLLRAKPGRGKNVAFDVTFGARSASAYTDGGAYATASVDAKVPATMPWAYYHAPFSVSVGAIDSAMSSGGTPEELMDVFRDSLTDAMRSLASKINADVLAGTGSDGTNTTITGFLGGALANSGTYANIARATYTEWKGNVLANGGTPRALSIALMNSVDEAIFTACGCSPDLIIMNPAQQTAYKGLFTTYTQFMQGSSGQVAKLGASTNDLTFNMSRIVRDKDCTAGSVLFLCTQECELVYLPAAQLGLDGSMAQHGGSLDGASGMDGGDTSVGVPFVIEALPRSGSVYNFNLRTTVQLKVRRPNAFGILADIS